MLRCANRRSFFRCVHVQAVLFLERRPKLNAHLQDFASPFASKAGRHDASTCTLLKPPASKRSRNRSSACVAGSKVCTKQVHHARGDATLSVHDAGSQDVDAQFCNDEAKSHSVDGDAMVVEFTACMPHANMRFDNGDVRGAESVASPNDDIIEGTSANLKVNRLASNVSNASGETQSLHVSLQTFFEQKQKKMLLHVFSDMQKKIELLESEQFSLSEAKTLLKTRAFNACSVEQLATVLEKLKEIFPCARVLHDILISTPTLLLQPAELVQQKLKILNDFQVKDEIVTKLCVRGKALSVSAERLQVRLMFYDHIGLSVDARNMMFSRGPMMLLFSIENHIQPTLNVMKTTGLMKESICRLVQHCPEIFYVKLNTVVKKFEYFRQLGFSAIELPKVCNALRRLSIERMDERLQSLKNLGFTHDDTLLMVKKQPGILRCAPDKLKCNLDFLVREQKRNMAEIVRSPCSLMYSLEARIAPRFSVVKEVGSSKVFSLSYILDATDSKFEERFGKGKESKLSGVPVMMSSRNGLCQLQCSNNFYESIH